MCSLKLLETITLQHSFFLSENNELWIKYKNINLAQRKWECKKCKKRIEMWKVKRMESEKNDMEEPASIVKNG